MINPLSISIISYNRANDLLALLQSIDNLENIRKIVDKVFILNNNSVEDYSNVEDYITNSDEPYYDYEKSDINLGVSAGRNKIFTKVKSDLLLEIDDDMVITQSEFLVNIINFFDNCDKNIGVLGFEVRYFANNEIQKNTLLHKKFEKYVKLSSFYTYYFAGGAHVFRMEAVKSELELYPKAFFYGMEEYDLGYRILDKGYKISYQNSIKILHKESPSGRLPSAEKLKNMWVNKTLVTYKYLPIYYTLSCTTLWAIHFLVHSKLDFRNFIKGSFELVKKMMQTNRTPIKASTLAYLKSVEARLTH